MIINKHILKLENVYYVNNKFYVPESPHNNEYKKFIHNYEINNDFKCQSTKVIDNILCFNTLHSCFSHALIDGIFPIYWCIKDINEDPKNVTLFVRKKSVMDYKLNNLSKIDSVRNRYKGVWNEITSLLSDKIQFEHLIKQDERIFIKKCYFYIIIDYWQRSPWNCMDYYRGRGVLKHNVDFKDDVINSNLVDFSQYVKKNLQLVPNKKEKPQVIIIDRRNDRKWEPEKLNKIVHILLENNNVQYNGVHILENMNLYHQIKLFVENNVFIFRHGSCITHLIWIPNNSIIFDIDTDLNERKNVVRRLATISDSKTIQLNYNDIDYSQFKFDKL